MFIVAQLLGIVIIIGNAVTMQLKRKKEILIGFIIINAICVVQFCMLQGYSASLICFVAIIQAVINYQYERKEKEFPKYLVILYILSSFLCGMVTYQKPLDVLPVIAAILYTLSIIQNKEKNLRILVLLNITIWAIYDTIIGAYTNTISDIVFMGSTIIGMVRYDILKGKKEKIHE